MLDLEAIRARAASAPNAGWIDTQTVLDEDVPALIAEITRLRALTEAYCDACGEDLNDGRDVVAYHRECQRARSLGA